MNEETEKSFPNLEKLFTAEELAEFISTPISDLYLYHFSLGMWIRNNLLYPEGSCLCDLLLENGIEHPDDMSFFIIKSFHDYLSKKNNIT